MYYGYVVLIAYHLTIAPALRLTSTLVQECLGSQALER